MEQLYKKLLGKQLLYHENKFYICFNEHAFEVNEIGARIFELCDGDNTIKNMCEKLGEIYDIDKDLLKNDIISFIDILIEKKLIKVI